MAATQNDQLEDLIKIDNGWYAAPVHDPNGKRLERLHSYGLLDTPPEAAFDRISALAAALFATPIALVNMIDRHRQWFKSCYGMGDMSETPLDHAFCTHALCSNEHVMVVTDASRDTRFYNNPLVTEWPHIRFYAGAPMINRDGYKIGTLCIIDRMPREDLGEEQKHHLASLADIAMDQVELSLANRKAGKTLQRLQANAPHKQERAQKGQPPQKNASNGTGRNHLLVAGCDRQILENLETCGYAYEHCNTPDAALAIVAEQDAQFDGIVLGKGIDDSDMRTVSRKLRTMQSRRYRNIPIIGVSPSLDREAMELHMQAGMNDVLQAPVRLESLKNSLREYLAS